FTGKLPPMHTKTFSINTYYNGAPDWPLPDGGHSGCRAGSVLARRGGAVVEEGACKAGGKAQYLLLLHDRGAFHARIQLCVRWRTDCRNAAHRAKPKHVQEIASPRHRSVQEGGIYQVVAPHHRSLWHRVGTVRFGMDPETSVLDPNCKVHEIEGLYVVD